MALEREALQEGLFLVTVPDELTGTYHCHSGDKQVHRRRKWFDVRSDKRSKRVHGHNNEKCREKDRNFC